MSHQINLTDGLAMLVDGSGPPANEFHITPTVGDVNANNTSEVEVYLHRGKVQVDGDRPGRRCELPDAAVVDAWRYVCSHQRCRLDVDHDAHR